MFKVAVYGIVAQYPVSDDLQTDITIFLGTDFLKDLRAFLMRGQKITPDEFEGFQKILQRVNSTEFYYEGMEERGEDFQSCLVLLDQLRGTMLSYTDLPVKEIEIGGEQFQIQTHRAPPKDAFNLIRDVVEEIVLIEGAENLVGEEKVEFQLQKGSVIGIFDDNVAVDGRSIHENEFGAPNSIVNEIRTYISEVNKAYRTHLHIKKMKNIAYIQEMKAKKANKQIDLQGQIDADCYLDDRTIRNSQGDAIMKVTQIQSDDLQAIDRVFLIGDDGLTGPIQLVRKQAVKQPADVQQVSVTDRGNYGELPIMDIDSIDILLRFYPPITRSGSAQEFAKKVFERYVSSNFYVDLEQLSDLLDVKVAGGAMEIDALHGVVAKLAPILQALKDVQGQFNSMIPDFAQFIIGKHVGTLESWKSKTDDLIETLEQTLAPARKVDTRQLPTPPKKFLKIGGEVEIYGRNFTIEALGSVFEKKEYNELLGHVVKRILEQHIMAVQDVDAEIVLTANQMLVDGKPRALSDSSKAIMKRANENYRNIRMLIALRTIAKIQGVDPSQIKNGVTISGNEVKDEAGKILMVLAPGYRDRIQNLLKDDLIGPDRIIRIAPVIK